MRIPIARTTVFGYMADVRANRQNTRCLTNPVSGVRHPYSYTRSAFSLIELLIVLALLVVMTTMYYGFGSQSHQTRQKKNCAANLEKIYISLEIYATDHNGKFPDVPGSKTSEEALDGLIPRYTSDTSIFICPGSKDSDLPAGESIRKRKISYAYYMGRRSADKEALMSDRQIDTDSKAAGQMVFSSTGKPPGNNHHKYGGNFLFCDGRLESSEPNASFPLTFTQGVELLNP